MARRECPGCGATHPDDCSCTRCPACDWMNDDDSVEAIDFADGWEIVWIHAGCADEDHVRFSTNLDLDPEEVLQ